MDGQWDRLRALVLRDLMVLAAAGALWWLVLRSGWPHGGGFTALQVLTGLMTVVVGYLLHEWGHLGGAWLAGSAFELPPGPLAGPFLFRFNNVRNSRRQFCLMSLGGFASSLLFVALLLAALPRGLLASAIAGGLVALGVLATLLTEVPGLVRVWRGAPLPGGPAYVSDPLTVAERQTQADGPGKP
jgi:hypothetical protein